MEDWLRAVAIAYASGAEGWTAGAVTVQRVRGGANNALYCVTSGGDQYACKLCVADERRRAEREYAALCILQDAGLDLAPQPLLLDTTCNILPFPIVVYRWLLGEALRPPLGPEQLAGLLYSI